MKDAQIKKLIEAEKKRQKSVINLIASENYVSSDVLDALGSELTNKYAEGYSGARYYGGNENIDKIEDLCKERALKTFKLSDKTWSVNVQALSGSPANVAVYNAVLKPGDKIMGMNLSDGGHLSHGHKVSITGKLYKQISFGVDLGTGKIDYEALLKLAKKEKPQIIVAGFTAYPRKINWKKFREIADSCGAILLADISHVAGLIAGGVYPGPFKYADIVTTTTHKTLRGPRAALIFSKKELSKEIDKSVFPGLQGGPHLNAIAATAVALKEAQSASFKKYSAEVVVNAKTLSDELKKLGWKIVSGGTDSHLILINTISNGISGKDASDKLEKVGIIVNKNTIPGESRSPVDPSGIRIGAAAETTRGKKQKDFVQIAKKIDKVLRA
jgi:glycine hydroxymethyltransferase